MDPAPRTAFNAAFDEALYERYSADLERRVGEPIGFRLAETPVFLPPSLRERCERAGSEIIERLCAPAIRARLREAIPPQWDVPGESDVPEMAILDFAIVEEADGSLAPRLVEIQGFASLLAFEVMQYDAWAAELARLPGVEGMWSCWFGGRDRAGFLDLAQRTIVGDHDPRHVALVDLDPQTQKTGCDFLASKTLFGIDAVCPTELEKRGRRLFRRDASGQAIPLERIYWRVVIDELERKNVVLPFDLREDLDVEWVPHPNWFFTWSKHSLPFLRHPAVPETRFVSEVETLPEDLETNYVLKPLFSFAGGGVNVAPNAADVAAIPAAERGGWCLQRKIAYAPALRAVDGDGVKVELRMMYFRPAETDALEAGINLCRLSRGVMHGVDYNKNLTWVGSSIGIWR